MELFLFSLSNLSEFISFSMSNFYGISNQKLSMPKFSFIIPAHNEEKSIGKCLSSILKQKGSYEIIVVNDGSTDNTARIVERYKKKYSRKLKLINFSKGHSAAFARNKGVRIAKGKWLIFVDADQIVEKNFLKKVEAFLDKTEVDGSDYLVYSYRPRTIFQRAWSVYRIVYPSLNFPHIIKERCIFETERAR